MKSCVLNRPKARHGHKKTDQGITHYLTVGLRLVIVFSLVFGNWLPFRYCGEGPVVLRPTLSSGLPLSDMKEAASCKSYPWLNGRV